MGKRSLIAPGPNFEADYQVTRGIARTTWLRRDFFPPDYGAHPWAMWQANDYVRLSGADGTVGRSEEHTSELQSLMRISYAVFCLKTKNTEIRATEPTTILQI